jgi:hypothetical protein
MLQMNPVVLFGGYLSHLVIWTAIYALAPLVRDLSDAMLCSHSGYIISLFV